jgi:UDP-N-acetylmuramate-alanine ligase
MGKYSKKKKKKTGGILLVLVPVLLLAALIWFATRGNAPWADQTGATDPALTDTAPAATGEWETLPEVTAFLKENIQQDDVVLTMGAGDIFRAGEALLEE